MSSIGTPFVSGSKNTVNNPMKKIQTEKKKNMFDFIWHNIDKNAWAMPKVKNMLVLTANAKPAVLVSKGNISVGINQPRGPHDHAKAITNTHTKNTTAIARVLLSEPVSFK